MNHIIETHRKHGKHAIYNLYDRHNRLEHRRNSGRSFRNRNFKQQVPSYTLVKFGALFDTESRDCSLLLYSLKFRKQINTRDYTYL